jgi:hypothetical protein
MPLATPTIRIALQKLFIPDLGRNVNRIYCHLKIATSSADRYAALPYRLDTGSDLMTIPIELADQFGIPFDKTVEVYPRTVAGYADKASYLSPVTFVFPAIPKLELIQTACSLRTISITVFFH